MSIKPVYRLVYERNTSPLKYRCCDGLEFLDLEEAVEHDNKLHAKDIKPVIPEQIETIQQAINMAVGENRVVRFISRKKNTDIKKGIVDIKGCKLMKPDKDSDQIAVVPPTITDFVF